MKWKILNTKQIVNSQQQTVIKEIIDILLQNRGFKTEKQRESFLHPTIKELNEDFFEKKQLKKALERISLAIKNNEQIIVYSDYDVDGITGGAILWETLDSLGAKVMPYVPNRMDEGYGMSKKGIDSILSQYPDAKLIVTVDHGITAVEQTLYAKEKGLDVIITDHHTIGRDLPKADAIVHSTELAGSGVAYVFSRKILRHCSDAIHGIQNKDATHLRGHVNRITTDSEHLALAALGTIGDLVPLTGANRVIAKYGLEALNKTKRIGLLSLFEAAKLLGKKIGTYEVGFVIAPRINASGRLTHALDALRLLCTKSEKRARELASLLNSTNLERQAIMAQSSEHAITLITDERKLLFVAHESYHEGVIGLIAGRLVEKYYRPAIVIAKGTILSKASARSITGFNIVEAIRNSSDLLLNVGGHPMAAGFTIETEKLSLLEEKLRAHVEEILPDHLLERELKIDTVLPFSAISKKLFSQIQSLAPFGIGNPEPIFATENVQVIDATVVGSEGQHVRLRIEHEGVGFEAIAFGKGQLYGSLSPNESVNIAYNITENTWNGNTKMQLKVKDIT